MTSNAFVWLLLLQWHMMCYHSLYVFERKLSRPATTFYQRYVLREALSIRNLRRKTFLVASSIDKIIDLEDVLNDYENDISNKNEPPVQEVHDKSNTKVAIKSPETTLSSREKFLMNLFEPSNNDDQAINSKHFRLHLNYDYLAPTSLQNIECSPFVRPISKPKEQRQFLIQWWRMMKKHNLIYKELAILELYQRNTKAKKLKQTQFIEDQINEGSTEGSTGYDTENDEVSEDSQSKTNDSDIDKDQPTQRSGDVYLKLYNGSIIFQSLPTPYHSVYSNHVVTSADRKDIRKIVSILKFAKGKSNVIDQLEQMMLQNIQYKERMIYLLFAHEFAIRAMIYLFDLIHRKYSMNNDELDYKSIVQKLMTKMDGVPMVRFELFFEGLNEVTVLKYVLQKSLSKEENFIIPFLVALEAVTNIIINSDDIVDNEILDLLTQTNYFNRKYLTKEVIKNLSKHLIEAFQSEDSREHISNDIKKMKQMSILPDILATKDSFIDAFYPVVDALSQNSLNKSNKFDVGFQMDTAFIISNFLGIVLNDKNAKTTYPGFDPPEKETLSTMLDLGLIGSIIDKEVTKFISELLPNHSEAGSDKGKDTTKFKGFGKKSEGSTASSSSSINNSGQSITSVDNSNKALLLLSKLFPVTDTSNSDSNAANRPSIDVNALRLRLQQELRHSDFTFIPNIFISATTAYPTLKKQVMKEYQLVMLNDKKGKSRSTVGPTDILETGLSRRLCETFLAYIARLYIEGAMQRVTAQTLTTTAVKQLMSKAASNSKLIPNNSSTATVAGMMGSRIQCSTDLLYRHDNDMNPVAVASIINQYLKTPKNKHSIDFTTAIDRHYDYIINKLLDSSKKNPFLAISELMRLIVIEYGSHTRSIDLLYNDHMSDDLYQHIDLTNNLLSINYIDKSRDSVLFINKNDLEVHFHLLELFQRHILSPVLYGNVVINAASTINSELENYTKWLSNTSYVNDNLSTVLKTNSSRIIDQSSDQLIETLREYSLLSSKALKQRLNNKFDDISGSSIIDHEVLIDKGELLHLMLLRQRCIHDNKAIKLDSLLLNILHFHAAQLVVDKLLQQISTNNHTVEDEGIDCEQVVSSICSIFNTRPIFHKIAGKNTSDTIKHNQQQKLQVDERRVDHLSRQLLLSLYSDLTQVDDNSTSTKGSNSNKAKKKASPTTNTASIGTVSKQHHGPITRSYLLKKYSVKDIRRLYDRYSGIQSINSHNNDQNQDQSSQNTLYQQSIQMIQALTQKIDDSVHHTNNFNPMLVNRVCLKYIQMNYLPMLFNTTTNTSTANDAVMTVYLASIRAKAFDAIFRRFLLGEIPHELRHELRHELAWKPTPNASVLDSDKLLLRLYNTSDLTTTTNYHAYINHYQSSLEQQQYMLDTMFHVLGNVVHSNSQPLSQTNEISSTQILYEFVDKLNQLLYNETFLTSLVQEYNVNQHINVNVNDKDTEEDDVEGNHDIEELEDDPVFIELFEELALNNSIAYQEAINEANKQQQMKRSSGNSPIREDDIPVDLLLKLCQLHRARVIAVGDIHGCADELGDLLRKSRYKPGDKLLMLGDLVYKGPRSTGVIQLAIDLNAIAVRGNHDHEVLRQAFRHAKKLSYYISTIECNEDDNSESNKKQSATDTEESGPPSEYKTLLSNKNKILVDNFKKYLNNVYANEHLKIALSLSPKQINYMLGLPHYIISNELACLFVHAGLNPEISLKKQPAWLLLTIRSYKDNKCSNKFIRNQPWAEYWKGPLTVYFGHDSGRGVRKYSHAQCLDGSCVYGGNLTAIILPEETIVQVPAKKKYYRPKYLNMAQLEQQISDDEAP